MTSRDELASLLARYPLPLGVELLEPYFDTASVGGLSIYLVGIAVQYEGECVTGSAGSLLSPPTLRAYMELLERLCVLTSPPSRDPRGGDTSTWRPARSNGVAIGTDFESAAVRARLELVERDRVLRSWFGGPPPRAVSVDALVPGALATAYRFEACSFEEVHGIHTAGVFGFPLGGAPLVYGFASRHGAPAALSAAFDECIQRMGFLWGEDVPEVSPPPAPTPAFHQEHFLCPSNHDALRRWLRGQHPTRAALRAAAPSALPGVEELRPSWFPSNLSVVRALPRGHVPLGFGLPHPLALSPVPQDLAVHPVV